MKKRVSIICSFCLSFSWAQNLDQIGKKDMVKVSGGASWNMTANMVDDQQRTRDPFTWVASGNVNFNVLGVSLPFTFSYTNRQTSFTQPFNMTALHPSYKWFKSHIGITSMSLSPYTYSGMNFAGAGVEMTPKKWSIKAFGGRLKKAVAYDAVQNNLHTVSYRRMGGGVSVGYENKGYGATLIVFKAADDPASLAFLSPNNQLLPMDNWVSSMQAKGKFTKWLDAQAEFANSLLTRNTLLSTDSNMQRGGIFQLVNGNSTSTAANAYNASLNARAKWFSLSLKYERVDPGYQTLGALYFNNDLENITVAPVVNFMKGKVVLNANTGFQRNNLKHNTANQMKRWVGNFGLNVQPMKGMTCTVNYSNFSSFTKRNPAADPYYNPAFDTLNVYQVNASMSAMTSYSWGKTNPHSLTGNYTFSESQNITGSLADAGAFGYNVENVDQSPAVNHTGMLAYNWQLKAKEMAVGFTGNYNQSKILGQLTTYLGPGMNMHKKLFQKKIALTTGVIYNRQLLNSNLASHIMNLRLGANFSPELWDKKYGKLNGSLQANYAHRFAIVQGGLVPKNLTIVANLNYSF